MHKLQRRRCITQCGAILVLITVFVARGARVSAASPPCVSDLNYPGGDLPGMPVAANATACDELCVSDSSCVAYAHHASGCSAHGERCALGGGCCWLKAQPGDPVESACTCSALVRPQPDPRPVPDPPPGAKSVLYIIIDDLRPELGVYSRPVATPSMAALAARGVVFDRAYCQQAVCSPSRMSFLTGRRPASTGAFNFVNHVRQADCGLDVGGARFTGDVLATTRPSIQQGGAGQCCTDCAMHPHCRYWSYAAKSGTCTLLSSKSGAVPDTDAVSGVRGSFTRANWTTTPNAFRSQGYLTCGTGKIFHTEEGGTGPAPWDGNGMVPNQDPPSWSAGCSMEDPNGPAPMLGCKLPTDGGDDGGPVGSSVARDGTGPCRVNATRDGNVLDGSGSLCDKVIGDDAVAKLRLAKRHRDDTGRPFFLAVGFRKPHLAFRAPAPWVDDQPPAAATDVAKYPTLNESIPPISHRDAAPIGSPYTAPPQRVAQTWRKYYRACVAWADHQVGVVLKELKALGLENDTAVVLHSDHGWSLGENGQFQKFTNYELGTRVPLIVSAPWAPFSAGHGQRTAALAELVDVLPTLVDLAGVPLPSGEVFDGTSLTPVLRAPATATVKPAAFSQFPRCPMDASNSSTYWSENACEFVDRTMMPYMGVALRTDAWRYVEWRHWDGAMQQVDWERDPVGRELYSHVGDTGQQDFDSWEHANEVADNPETAAQLSVQLKRAFLLADASLKV